jgi:DNA-binding MarR family transcriptional regulator
MTTALRPYQHAISIRRLLELRSGHGDQLALDYLSLAALLRYSPGIASTADLIAAWKVSQPNVSRRINALDQAGLIDAYPGHGAYQIHDLRLL